MYSQSVRSSSVTFFMKWLTASTSFTRTNIELANTRSMAMMLSIRTPLRPMKMSTKKNEGSSGGRDYDSLTCARRKHDE